MFARDSRCEIQQFRKRKNCLKILNMESAIISKFKQEENFDITQHNLNFRDLKISSDATGWKESWSLSESAWLYSCSLWPGKTWIWSLNKTKFHEFGKYISNIVFKNKGKHTHSQSFLSRLSIFTDYYYWT